jgi:MoaA/NifB/PqqE/SkfB family radical SAM enzyme
MFLELDNVLELHVEITNACNAACPMCARSVFGGPLRLDQGLSDWTLEDIKRVFNKEKLPNLRFVYFCGTHGDPLASKNVFEAIKAVKDMGADIEMFTNGSLKTDDWWRKLTAILGPGDRMTFGVDGLKTNHLYRQNTDIDKILSHMRICCESECKVRWDFLAFKHNEHEYEECQRLAHEMGVDDFRLRRTARFDVFKTKFPVINNDGDITHFLEPPEQEELRHPNLKEMGEMTSKMHGDMYDGAELTKESLKKFYPPKRTWYKFQDKPLPAENFSIDCIYKGYKKLYVNSRMEVYPCCYISDEYENFKTLANGQLPYPKGELTLRDKDWDEILEHPFFAHQLEDSWTSDNVIPRCVRTCGVVKREAEQNVSIELKG